MLSQLKLLNEQLKLTKNPSKNQKDDKNQLSHQISELELKIASQNSQCEYLNSELAIERNLVSQLDAQLKETTTALIALKHQCDIDKKNLESMDKRMKELLHQNAILMRENLSLAAKLQHRQKDYSTEIDQYEYVSVQ